MRVLVRATLTRSLSTGAFLECARGVRHAVTHATDADSVRLVSDVRRFIERAAKVQSAADDPRGHATMVVLERSLRNGVRATEGDLAALLGIAPADLGRLMREHTGLRFTFCRIALAVRLAAHELSTNDKHISQIAYRLGYEHPSQLDRDFHRIFNLSPRYFRKLARQVVPSTATRVSRRRA